jgi:hypothetical protein
VFGGGHEHMFYAHEDPRWLLCDCGQYAVRTRTSHGQPTVRLIDPPQPALRHLTMSDLCTEVRTAELDPAGAPPSLERQPA